MTGQSLDPRCLLDPKSLPHFCKKGQCEQPEKQLLQREQARGRSEQTGHWEVLSEKNSSRSTERRQISKEDTGQTQMWTEFAKDYQTGGARGPSGIWDYYLEQEPYPTTLQYEHNHWFPWDYGALYRWMWCRKLTNLKAEAASLMFS